MNKLRTSLLAGIVGGTLMLCLLPSAQAQEAGWKIASAPLLTRFAREVSPEKVRPEYPRPLLVRKEWKSLNGLWEFAFDDADTGKTEGWQSGHSLQQHILVPFTFEAALSGIGKGKEVHERVWYRRAFEVPVAWKGKRVRLNFGAVDWEATVWVNGKEQGMHQGGYAPFSFDITDALKPNGPQEIVVGVFDPADPRKNGVQPKGKQLGSEGIWYTRTTGIWQSVWLEPVAPYHIASIKVTPELNGETHNDTLTVQAIADGPVPDTEKTQLDIVVSRNGRQVARANIGVSAGALRAPTVKVAAENIEHWTPENPALYDVTLTLKQNGRVVDEAKTYTAFRQSGIANGRLTLNGKPYFYRGVLDQGYWPDGILTPPTDAAIKNDVEMTKKLGFNMARKHVKVEDPRWYYWCDRLGLAVWQDMPSSHNLSSAEARQNFEREWTEAVAATRNYPCVIHWIPFNENWGNPQAFQDHIVTLTRQLDPTRPITDASGWTQRGLTDVIDAHDYSNNLIAQGVTNPVKPKVVGEYGGIALPVPAHTWTTGWGYQTVKDPEGLLRRIRYQTSQLFEAANLSGYVYTQLTDVEQELNGLMTYDRMPKSDLKQTAAIFEGLNRAARGGYIRDWLTLGPIPSGTDLRAADDNAGNRAVMDKLLATPYLSDEGELRPEANSGVNIGGKNLTWRRVHLNEDQLDFHKEFGGNMQNAVAYAVAYVDSPNEVKNVTLLLGSDDGATVWLNGKKIWTASRIRGVALDDDTIPALTLKAGRNILVVKVGQGVGGWGLAARFELPNGSPLKTTVR